MARKKQPSTKTLGIVRGPIKLKPTQVHKSKKAYSRKREKIKMKLLAGAARD